MCPHVLVSLTYRHPRSWQVCVYVCVNMPDDEEQIENEMVCTFSFPLSLSMCGCLCVLCVCLVNLFRLFSLLQTHANEIEWGRMTSIQAQTDSLISRSLSLLSSFSNPALLTDSFFLSAVFFTCLLSFFFFYSPPCRPPPSHTPGFAQTPSHVHASLKACKQAESLTTMHRPQEGRSHKHCALPGGFASIR